ncbi:hypothetical protein NB723_000231 [Xanthomonas sacchari]|nr:hypothetical protein [Xanthomonas sacchari]
MQQRVAVAAQAAGRVVADAGVALLLVGHGAEQGQAFVAVRRCRAVARFVERAPIGLLRDQPTIAVVLADVDVLGRAGVVVRAPFQHPPIAVVAAGLQHPPDVVWHLLQHLDQVPARVVDHLLALERAVVVEAARGHVAGGVVVLGEAHVLGRRDDLPVHQRAVAHRHPVLGVVVVPVGLGGQRAGGAVGRQAPGEVVHVQRSARVLLGARPDAHVRRARWHLYRHRRLLPFAVGAAVDQVAARPRLVLAAGQHVAVAVVPDDQHARGGVAGGRATLLHLHAGGGGLPGQDRDALLVGDALRSVPGAVEARTPGAGVGLAAIGHLADAPALAQDPVAIAVLEAGVERLLARGIVETAHLDATAVADRVVAVPRIQHAPAIGQVVLHDALDAVVRIVGDDGAQVQRATAGVGGLGLFQSPVAVGVVVVPGPVDRARRGLLGHLQQQPIGRVLVVARTLAADRGRRGGRLVVLPVGAAGALGGGGLCGLALPIVDRLRQQLPARCVVDVVVVVATQIVVVDQPVEVVVIPRLLVEPHLLAVAVGDRRRTAAAAGKAVIGQGVGLADLVAVDIVRIGHGHTLRGLCPQ